MNKYTPEQLDKWFEMTKEILMDPHNKLRAIELRSVIDGLYPREEEISKKDLAEVNKRIEGLNEKIRKVEECLGIDFKLDKVKPEANVVDYIDYHFIKDNLLQEKATAYFREMLRYQYATRNHKQCFGEFCRLATIQIELMLNYFFSNKTNFQLLEEEVNKLAQNDYKRDHKKWVDENKSGDEPQKEVIKNELSNNIEETVHRIFLSTKRDIFIKRFNYLEKLKINQIKFKSIFIWTSDMRNRKSHGGINTTEPNEEHYLTEEEKQNLIKWDNELLEYFQKHNKTKNGATINFKNNKRVGWAFNSLTPEKQTIFNKFQPLQWISEKPFNDVHELLRIVASTCAKELKIK